MPLNAEERAELMAEAKRRGMSDDEAKAFVSGAEESDGDEPKAGVKPEPAGVSPEAPKLFQYHLPFVRVREVREKWLGLTESFPGDDEVAAKWAAKMEGPSETPDGAAPGPEEQGEN